MSYSVAGLVRDFCPPGYPEGAPMVPHGMSVIVNAPAVFNHTAPACPERHLEAAALLGGGGHDATPGEAGEVLAGRLVSMMRATEMPNGLSGVGYSQSDIAGLTEGAYPQRRLIENAPLSVGKTALSGLFADAMSYW